MKWNMKRDEGMCGTCVETEFERGKERTKEYLCTFLPEEDPQSHCSTGLGLPK